MRAVIGKKALLLALGAMLPLWYVMAYHLDRSDFGLLILLFAALFALYGLSCASVINRQTYWIAIGGAILVRLLLIPSLPWLSDDIYRFIWDGRLLAQGIDPLAHVPRWFMQHPDTTASLKGIEVGLFQKLNSPDYYTVYPPFCQGIFSLAGWLFPQSEWGSIIFLRSLMIIAEGTTLFLLSKLCKYFQLPYRSTILFALNPLVIAELTGNLHFEGFMITFLLGAFWLILQSQILKGGILMSAGIATKLLPLIFLPGLIRRLGWLKTIGYGIMSGIILGASLLLISHTDRLWHMAQSLDLYFQTFEFNASCYYLFRWLGFQWQGYNMVSTIGPVLGFISAAGIIGYAIFEKKPTLKNWPTSIILSLTIYLALSTTVHPWYITPALAFGIFTRFWFPWVWSFTVLLSYATYQTTDFQENYALTAFEYLVTFLVLGFDLWKNFKQKGGVVV